MLIKTLMENTARDGLHAEHGLSLYIETHGLKILFDAGQSHLFAENAAIMGVDLAKVDFAILSHGHYDHSGGLMRFLEINEHAPVYVHRCASEPHYNGTEKYIGIDPQLAASSRLIYTGEEITLAPGIRLCALSDRVSRFDPPPHGLTVLENGSFVPEDFRHEQYLVVEEGGRKIVFSGCSHRGVLNILDWLNPDILIGGFHFMKLEPDSAALRQAAASLAAFPAVCYTGHCTGEAQFTVLKELLGDKVHYLPGGSELIL